jgi:hypothetical protein
MAQKTATNRGHIDGTRVGLGNRRSIRLSYGANGSFPRFPPVTGQPATRKTRRKGMSMSAHRRAQRVYDMFSLAEAALPAGKWKRQSVSGCWLWTGSLNSNGYGKFKRAGRMTYAHRASFEAAKGPIPRGLTIDHLCRNRRCCNPDHLEAVTHQENVRRAPRVRKTHCLRGHLKSGDNLYIDPTGRWRCRACRAQAA